MAKSVTYLVASFLLMAMSVPAFAREISKEDLKNLMRKVGVHANIGVRAPTDKDVTEGLTTGISIGLAPGSRSGWKFPVSLSSYGEDLNGPSGDHFGRLTMQGLYAGVGYGWHAGSRFSTSVALQAGYSRNKVRAIDTNGRAFASGDPVSIDVDNSFVLRPRWNTEYFVARKMSVRTSLNYVITNPDIVVMTAAGRETQTWKPSALNASVGVAFYPFLRR
jgi:hypothetical protein